MATPSFKWDTHSLTARAPGVVRGVYGPDCGLAAAPRNLEAERRARVVIGLAYVPVPLLPGGLTEIQPASNLVTVVGETTGPAGLPAASRQGGRLAPG